MILAFIAIAGLLLSNKDNVLSFINKHNINWFERNLVNSQQQQQQQHQQFDKNLNAAAAPPPSADGDSGAAIVDVAQNQLTALNNELHTNVVSPQSLVAANGMGNIQAIATTTKPATKIITKTVIAITNPPHDETITTTAAAQYEPAWKSLIDKITASNSNRNSDDFVAMNNAIGRNVGKAWSTVMAKMRATTTMSTPTTTTMSTTTTAAPLLPKQQPPVFIQQEIGHNGISGMDEEHHRHQQQIIDYDKSNNKIPIAIKPYWYIDPSLVYRAMTSPINPSDHSAAFILASLLFVVCLFFFLYCIMTDKLCCQCCCLRKRVKIKTESEIHEVNTTLLANHDYNNSSDED